MLVLGCSPTLARDYFECWESDTAIHEEWKTESVFELELSLPAAWRPMPLDSRFVRKFQGPEGVTLAVIRQAGDENPTAKQEGRQYGAVWQGVDCGKELNQWVQHLGDATLRTYRSRFPYRGWVSWTVLTIKRGESWYTLELAERWRKRNGRSLPGASAQRIFKQVDWRPGLLASFEQP